MVYLITGGSGSGKSEYAEGLVMNSSRAQRFYVATMTVYGAEGRAKVERHRMQRRGKGFITVECQRNVRQALSGSGRNAAERSAVEMPDMEMSAEEMSVPQWKTRRDAILLLECVSNLAANEMFGQSTTAQEKGGLEPDCGSKMNSRPDIDSLAVRLADDIRFLASQVKDMVIVTNEVASDGIRYDPETMDYIRLMGLLNRKLAGLADRVVEVVYGIPVVIK